MTLRDLLKKRDKVGEKEEPEPSGPAEAPEFTIIRSDTHRQEIISPPSFPSDLPAPKSPPRDPDVAAGKRKSRLRSLSSNSRDSRGEKRLSNLLHMRSSSYGSRSSTNVPQDLPNIDDGVVGAEDREAQWEKRATALVQGSAGLVQGMSPSSPPSEPARLAGDVAGAGSRPSSRRSTISNAKGDDDIQEAIRLHENGDLPKSTAMFGRLADPNGENNALAQVLYGLALRHGWGIDADAALAITYLSRAASNSASVESQALASGMKKGGAAKGELVLAIYELANCFRHGWGVQKDAVAARSYYETAANLGDTDAMNEIARCYEEGFGGKKDKFLASKYYRLAEERGNKILGNSWIWKEKYNPR